MIVSPYSVAVALALLSTGAKGTTFDQISHGLHITGDKNIIANKFNEHVRGINRKLGNATTEVANKIYLQDGNKINPEYRDIAINKFNSDIETTNFAESQLAATKINQWVENRTNDKIKNLINPRMLDANTKLVLVNAIYFKGAWESEFKKYATHTGQFWTSETQSVEVEFMKQTKHFLHAELNELEISVLKIKFYESDSFMLILLPDKRTGLSDLEEKLHSIDLKEIVTERMQSSLVEVTLPKFKIELQTELPEVLTKVYLFT